MTRFVLTRDRWELRRRSDIEIRELARALELLDL